MRALLARRVALTALLGSCLIATAQSQDQADETSATKAAPPAHVESRHSASRKGKHSHEVASNESGGKGVGLLHTGDRGGDHGSEARQQTAYDFGLPGEDGNNVPLSEYKGKVLLIVNLGRDSIYAAQLTALEKLNDSFKDKGLVILGVPSNDFGAAEPGSAADIARFYTNAKVNFPVMGVSILTGVHELPLFTYLAKSKSVPGDGLHWNYTKFLVDREGKVIVRFPPEVAPDSLEMMATVQEVLDGTWKPRKPSEGKEERAGGGDDSE